MSLPRLRYRATENRGRERHEREADAEPSRARQPPEVQVEWAVDQMADPAGGGGQQHPPDHPRPADRDGDPPGALIGRHRPQ
ncbi:hypothetical protein ABZU86_31880 [Streptomyces sp. NPDC005271]|uniref:hypothetical protein n=1 Tax=Streptomyces sp. NPDC005271 TaxID=3157030 RepID=UPI0033B12EF6